MDTFEIFMYNLNINKKYMFVSEVIILLCIVYI